MRESTSSKKKIINQNYYTECSEITKNYYSKLLLKITQNYSVLLRTQNYSELRITQNSELLRIRITTQNYSKLRITQNYSELLRITQNYSELLRSHHEN